ncbi:MBL fold metallo-hydrolase [Salinimicrobium sp. GXAS 041]|uniref:MBL fold metallo-hydrolase n=1 Tax=Salinimicrobium sp. GXAS 041 TaxID=3400806 RepID=UPI003C7180FC
MKRFILFFACSLALIGCKSESEKNLELAKELEEESFQNPGIDEDENSEEINIEPISHATLAINWGETTIYVDPTGGSEAFEGMNEADLVLLTDIHGDHMDPKTLSALNLGNTPIIAPQAVNEQLPDSLTQNLMVMNNGKTINEQGFSIEAIPMYNLREEARQYHEKGRGNGYVLEKDGKRLYIAGDTEDIPEMRNLENIDIAFVPMNLPYTMPVDAAADAVLDFAPKKVYPYHFRGQDSKADVDKFKQLVNEGNEDIEVVLANWYPNE